MESVDHAAAESQVSIAQQKLREKLAEIRQRIADSRPAAPNPQPFPLVYLLVLYELGNDRDLYCNYFEGFKLLVEWLSPIDIQAWPAENAMSRIPKTSRSYEAQQIAIILKTKYENIHYYGHQAKAIILQQQTDTAQLPTEIPTL